MNSQRTFFSQYNLCNEKWPVACNVMTKFRIFLSRGRKPRNRIGVCSIISRFPWLLFPLMQVLLSWGKFLLSRGYSSCCVVVTGKTYTWGNLVCNLLSVSIFLTICFCFIRVFSRAGALCLQDIQLQLYYAITDQILHSSYPPSKDLTQLVEDLHKRYYSIPSIPKSVSGFQSTDCGFMYPVTHSLK